MVQTQNSDYDVKHGSDVNVTHGTHYPKAVGIANVRGDQQVLDDIASAPRCAAYFDKTSTVFTVKAGETVTPLITINGAWMHGYVYVDWNNNRQFDVNITGEGPYIKGDGNELMCWSLYNHAGDGSNGWNSAGLYQGNGDVLAPGSFRVPEGVEEGSTYRMRYAIQWNSIDPSGSYANFISDGGAIIDVILKVSGVATDDEQNAYPIDDYSEPRVGTTPDEASWNAVAEGYTANYSNLFRIDVVGIATGIDEITDNRVQSTGVYDLQGRKIDTVTKAGIYIVNGKKRLVK